jgi:hypothetical protein
MNDLERSTSADASAARYPAPKALARWGNLGLVVGLAGVALLAVGYFTADGEHFFRSYLVGWIYWLSVALGSLALLMVHHLTTGAWGTVARRIFEAAVRTIPYLAVLFVPIYFGVGSLYEWTHEPLHGNKAVWLTPGNWLLRAVIYLAVWMVIGWLLTRWSGQQDGASPEGATALFKKMRALSGGGLVLFAFALTFAAFDWVMSLDPHWYSTIYGAWFFGGCGLGALGLLVLTGLFLSGREPMEGVIAKHHFHDWGKLLLAFTMLWAYFSLSQLLIIWSGNIPEEVLWYDDRLRGGWGAVGLALALLHFALPFLLLLSRDLKRQARMLAGVAILLLVMHWVDLYWNVVPNLSPENLSFHWLDVVAPLALGGLWVWLFVRELRKRPLLPVNDPYLEEVFTDGGH